MPLVVGFPIVIIHYLPPLICLLLCLPLLDGVWETKTDVAACSATGEEAGTEEERVADAEQK